MSQDKVVCVVKHSTMDVNMEKQAVLVSVESLSKFSVERNAAKFIKDEFDDRFGQQWHCVVGKQFGCYVSHYKNDFIYFYVNAVAILLYRTGNK